MHKTTVYRLAAHPSSVMGGALRGDRGDGPRALRTEQDGSAREAHHNLCLPVSMDRSGAFVVTTALELFEGVVELEPD